MKTVLFGALLAAYACKQLPESQLATEGERSVVFFLKDSGPLSLSLYAYGDRISAKSKVSLCNEF